MAPEDSGEEPKHTARRARSLLRLRTPDRGVVSVYLATPLERPELRGLSARVRSLLASVENSVADAAGPWLPSTLEAIGEALPRLGRRWLGRGVAVVSAPEAAVFEELYLPYPVVDRAVMGTHPYVRPLVTALQRCPAYHVAVVDRRNSWLFRADAYGIAPAGRLEGDDQRARSFAGWYGLEEYRTQRSAEERLQRHHRETASALEEGLREGESERALVGGHAEAVKGFVAELPGPVRERLAGTFVIDPHTMTPARVHELAGAVLADWERDRQRQVLRGVREEPGRRVDGLTDCVYVVNQRDAELLCLPEDLTVSGFVCDRCGGLHDSQPTCPLCLGPARLVDDVLDDMAFAVLTAGGRVESLDPSVVDRDTQDSGQFLAFPVALRRHS